MPVPPYSWQTSDFLTASRLNSELYRINGQPYLPNGLGFHVARPLYVAATGEVGSFVTTMTPGTYYHMGGATGLVEGWFVAADSNSYYGGKADNVLLGQPGGQYVPNGEGVLNSNGGLQLMFSTYPVASNATAAYAEIGIGTVAASAPSYGLGSGQTFWASAAGALYAVDIVDTSGGNWDTYVESNAAYAPYGGNYDGSGQCGRTGLMWASVKPSNGATVSAIPSPTAWASGSPAITNTLLNGTTGIAGVLDFLNMPPLLRANSAGGTTVNTGTTTAVSFSAGNVTYDTYAGFNATTDKYTVPLSGAYLVSGFTQYQPVGTISGTNKYAAAGIQVNSTVYWGPQYPLLSSTGVGCGKLQIMDLNAGDTIQLVTGQTSGATQNGVAGTLVVLYLGALGTPSTLWSVPDQTFLWTAGTPAASMPGLLSTHLQNDLSFLIQRPYFMGYASAAQTAFNPSTVTGLKIPTVGGLVHASTGDNYSGWSSANNNYVAQRSGWYLCVQESIMAAPSLTTSPSVRAGFQLSTVPSGAQSAQDWYQWNNELAGGTTGGGAAAINLYYLHAGDTIEPVLESFASSSTTTNTFAGSGWNSHFECIWISS